MPTFTEEAWTRNEALFQKTLAMPFNRELADGTLSAERFRHYMIQDAHYLVAFGRALAVAAARADDVDTMVQLAEAAQEAGESCIEVWGGGDDDLALWHPGRLRVRECSMPMLRVVDVVRALEERGWPADVAGRWCFDIADPLIPANTGAWVLELEGGRAHVSASTARGFPVSLSRLAQLVAGVLPAVDETVPADLARASALRPWAGIFEF